MNAIFIRHTVTLTTKRLKRVLTTRVQRVAEYALEKKFIELEGMLF